MIPSADVGFGVTGAFVGLLDGGGDGFGVTGAFVGLLEGGGVVFLEGLDVDFTGDDVGFLDGGAVGDDVVG